MNMNTIYTAVMMNTIKIEFDPDRKIRIDVDAGIPKVFIPVKIVGFEAPYLCFRYVDFVKNDRRLYMADSLYFFNGDVHVGQISEGNQVAAYENILAAHIDIWMHLDLATRIIEADREHPIIIEKL